MHVLAKVAEIMDMNACEWRIKEIKEWISDEDCEAIKGMPICQYGGGDRMVWP